MKVKTWLPRRSPRDVGLDGDGRYQAAVLDRLALRHRLARLPRRMAIPAALGIVAAAALVAFALTRGGIPDLASAGAPAVLPAAAIARLPALPNRPQRLLALTPEAARARNAAAPFKSRRLLPARPFTFAGAAIDRARAIDCLALAALAEAGGGERDQRAVIQVVLNRVRHPAYPRTVCGVVFQGSARATGCQFTFTCDGSLAREYGAAALAAARRRAAAALNGEVFAAIGSATHYHADYVYPTWSAELDKVAQVGPHLFFRWPGFWGSRDAERMAYRGGEPAIAALGERSAHAATLATAEPDGPDSAGGAPTTAGVLTVVVRHPDGDGFLVALPRRPDAAAALTSARALCGADGYCQVLGWSARASVPRAYPVTPADRGRLAFSYVLDARKTEIVSYDCTLFGTAPPRSCLPARTTG